ncbi:MAG: hypothetical protein JSS79_02020 [Bacteroidetes bacterium]|nr:hypothetical protein [Bacteroidota bacterium]
MKKAVALFLTIVFLFNVIGYYGIYLAMVTKAQSAMNQKIDSESYSADQTLTIKVPLSLPYPVQQNEYQSVQGDFEHGGEFYKLVKQKYSNDTLYIVCLKNTEEKKAFKTLKEFVNLSTDQSNATGNQNAKTIVNIIKDYNPVVAQIHFTQREAIALVKPAAFHSSKILVQDFPEFSPPPESAC